MSITCRASVSVSTRALRGCRSAFCRGLPGLRCVSSGRFATSAAARSGCSLHQSARSNPSLPPRSTARAFQPSAQRCVANPFPAVRPVWSQSNAITIAPDHCCRNWSSSSGLMLLFSPPVTHAAGMPCACATSVDISPLQSTSAPLLLSASATASVRPYQHGLPLPPPSLSYLRPVRVSSA